VNEFTSVFAVELNEHLAIRRKVLAPQSMVIGLRVLADFDRYATEYGVNEKRVTEDLTSGWIHRLREKNHSRTVGDKVGCLRIFLEYLRYSGLPVFMPSRPKWHEDYTPYIFTDTEMENIFRAADKDEPKITRGSLTDMRFEFPMLARLLYGCGLRLGEALSLTVGDVDFKRGLLLIRKAKNKKQRMVPMHESLTKTLTQYCAAMDITGKPNAFLFPGEKPGMHVSVTTADKRLKRILKSVNAYVPAEKSGRRGQCLIV
jgi:integrase